jgi:hypothetical protein
MSAMILMKLGIVIMGHLVLGVSLHGTALLIPDIPDVSEKPKCIVFNERRMTCTWATPANGIPTNYSLKYDLQCNQKSAQPCPLPSSNSCTWPEEGEGYFQSVIYYCIWLKGSNQLGSSSSESRIQLSDYVKPDAVTHLKVVSATSWSANISWMGPNLTAWKCHCNVSYQAECHELRLQNITSRSQRLMRVSLMNLTPFTRYSVTVSCIPVVNNVPKGYWSDPVSVEFVTNVDVPGQNPVVLQETFSTVSQLGDVDVVEIFWQTVAKCHLSDNETSVIVYYRISADLSSNTTTSDAVTNSPDWSEMNFSSDSVSAQLTLNSTMNYDVVVMARTSLGFNRSLPVVLLHIPPRINRLKLKDNPIVLQNSSEVTISWPYHVNVDRVYWCQAPVNSRTCQMAMQWLNVTNGTDSVKLFLDRPDLYLFAVRAKFQSPLLGVVTSELKWFDCVYDVNVAPRKPSNVILSPVGSINVMLEWTEPHCADTGYIDYYIIHYCWMNGSSCIDDKILHVKAPATRVMLEDSKPSVRYQARIMSSSWLANSSFTDFVQTSTISAFEATLSLTVIVSAVLTGCITTIILVSIVRQFWNFCWEIPITPPVHTVSACEDTFVQINNTDDGYSSHVAFFSAPMGNSTEQRGYAFMDSHAQELSTSSLLSYSPVLSGDHIDIFVAET